MERSRRECELCHHLTDAREDPRNAPWELLGKVTPTEGDHRRIVPRGITRETEYGEVICVEQADEKDESAKECPGDALVLKERRAIRIWCCESRETDFVGDFAYEQM